MSPHESPRTNKRGSAVAIALSAMAFAGSLIAVAIAVKAEDRAYARVVSEVGDAFKPMYRDFNLRYPSSANPSLREILTPLLEPIKGEQGTR
jgi:hypothetical protein